MTVQLTTNLILSCTISLQALNVFYWSVSSKGSIKTVMSNLMWSNWVNKCVSHSTRWSQMASLLLVFVELSTKAQTSAPLLWMLHPQESTEWLLWPRPSWFQVQAKCSFFLRYSFISCLKNVALDTAKKVEDTKIASCAETRRPATNPPLDWLTSDSYYLSRIARKQTKK